MSYSFESLARQLVLHYSWNLHKHVSLTTQQGMVTPISTVLRALTGDCHPIYDRCKCGLPHGLPLLSVVYKKKVTRSQWIFSVVTGSPAVLWSHSHRQFLDGHSSNSLYWMTNPCTGHMALAYSN